MQTDLRISYYEISSNNDKNKLKLSNSMNNTRRKNLKKAIELLNQALTIIEEMKEEEENAFDSLNESLQQTERGVSLEENYQKLEEAFSEIETVIENIEEVIN